MEDEKQEQEQQAEQHHEPADAGPTGPAPAASAPATFHPKRVRVEFVDHRDHHSATVYQETNAGDLLRAIGLPDNNTWQVLHRVGDPIPHDMRIYGLFNDGAVVHVARHPDHPAAKSAVPVRPVIGGR